jgi:hypothetical protein
MPLIISVSRRAALPARGPGDSDRDVTQAPSERRQVVTVVNSRESPGLRRHGLRLASYWQLGNQGLGGSLSPEPGRGTRAQGRRPSQRPITKSR